MTAKYYSDSYYGELANPLQWPQLRKRRRLLPLRLLLEKQQQQMGSCRAGPIPPRIPSPRDHPPRFPWSVLFPPSHLILILKVTQHTCILKIIPFFSRLIFNLFWTGITIMTRAQTCHPLEPLTAAEISVAVATVRAAGATPEVLIKLSLWLILTLNS